ncbi:Alpha/Beta hydrolase protein [Chytriomyces sp. MP71]|nr:Alpha/Beta hydrolase protein [Chytriomyces sp. MP71]
MTPTSWQPVDRPALNVETDFTTADIDAQLAARVSRYNCLERVRLCGFAKHAPNSLLVIGRDGSSVSDRAGNEVHLVDTRTGECAQLSALCSGDNLGANIMFLSPLSSGFLFGLDSGGNEAASLWSGLADKSDPTKFQFKELVPVAKGGRVKVGRVVVSADELTLAYTFNERNNSLQDIFILRRKSKDTPWSESTPVLAHEATVPGVHLITFTSDNRLIFAVAQSASSTLAFIAHLDPATGLLVTPIALQLPGARSSNVSIWDIVASHTSKDLFYVASDAYNEFHGLVEWNTATDTVRHVTTPGVVGTPCPLPWDLNSSVVAGSRVIFGVNENGRSLLKVLDTVDWRVASVEIPVGVVTGLVVDKSDFGRVSFTLDSTRHPSTLFELELDTMALRILSINLGSSAHSQETEEKLVRDPELITYKSFDGLEISAFLYTPPPEKASEGVKLPVVVYIHGGPASQYLPKYLPSNHSLSMRYLTDEMGIACVAPNIRGSIGYGSAFMEADDRLKREDALKDIESLVSWIALQPNLDPTRIAIMGRSYGGWAVLAALVFYPRAFKCGLATCGMSNFFTFYENTGPWRVDNRRQEYGDERIPAEREFLEKISPALHAEQITVPLYLAIGENDTRVPLSEAVQMAATVRERAGVDVWTLVGKKEGHVFEQKSVKDFHAVAQVAFLEKYLLA